MDIENRRHLEEYLRDRGMLGPHERLEFSVLAGGVSNRTVLVKRSSGADLVLKQALEKLRVATDWFSDPARIHREAEGMRVLASILPAGAVPVLVFEDADRHILAMHAVPQPHTTWKSSLLEGRIDGAVVRQFGRNLARIHYDVDIATYPSDGLLRNKDFFESLRIAPYYAYSAQMAPRAASFLEKLIDETRRLSETFVHGDYSPKNVLIREGRMVLLDHEVMHIGDPAFDIGFSMTHFLCKANHARATGFVDAACAYWSSYCRQAPADRIAGEFEARAVRHTLACLLARVAGRSPVEYLSQEARSAQKRAAIDLMQRDIDRIGSLARSFGEAVL